MQVLKDKDDALYTSLVRLAGGNAGIVMQVLSKPSRRTVNLGTVIQEIEDLRDRAIRAATAANDRASRLAG
jgi:hypothetical protein